MLRFHHRSALTKNTHNPIRQNGMTAFARILSNEGSHAHTHTHTLNHTVLHLSVVHYLSAAVLLLLKVFTARNTLAVKNAGLVK